MPQRRAYPAESDPQEMPSTESGRLPVVIEAVNESYLPIIYELNLAIFDEDRIINSFERQDLLMLLAYVGGEPAGFKIGYRESRYIFYSAKGGVLPEFRRHGIARLLLHDMMDRVRRAGFTHFAYDTFPNKNPGMTILGLNEGFRVTKADYNTIYRDYRLRFEIKL